jgi:hypothetical protein
MAHHRGQAEVAGSEIQRNYCFGSFFNISNDVGRVKGLDVFVFAVSDTRIALAPKCWFLRESDGLSLLR